MIQLIGAIVVLLALLGLIAYVWSTWFRGSVTGQSAVGKYITAVLDSGTFTANLGFVEVLSHVDVIEQSPAATAACNLIADTLWAAAKDAWKTAQNPPVTTPITAPSPASLELSDLEARIIALEKRPSVGGAV
jgi:hypothetical protein